MAVFVTGLWFSAQWLLGVLASYIMKSNTSNRGVKGYNNIWTPRNWNLYNPFICGLASLNLYVNMSIDWKCPLHVNLQLYVIFFVISYVLV